MTLQRYVSILISSTRECNLKKKKKNLFIFREGEGKERGRETSMYGCLSHAPSWAPGLQPRHVPWLGMETVTLWYTDWCSIHWATPARAVNVILFGKRSSQMQLRILRWECYPGLSEWDQCFTSVLVREREGDIWDTRKKRRQCDRGRRDWSEVATNWDMERMNSP